jgi:hypothetical protein
MIQMDNFFGSKYCLKTIQTSNENRLTYNNAKKDYFSNCSATMKKCGGNICIDKE